MRTKGLFFIQKDDVKISLNEQFFFCAQHNDVSADKQMMIMFFISNKKRPKVTLKAFFESTP